MPFMDAKVTLDRAGRVVLPKPLRDEMRLGPGTELQLEHDGERITLRPIRSQATLKKERGIWVYQGGKSDASIPELIDRVREKRLRENL
jgi:AbrB family looped-hinge helix DNA binding protein